jgi:hypothetical protein
MVQASREESMNASVMGENVVNIYAKRSMMVNSNRSTSPRTLLKRKPPSRMLATTFFSHIIYI